MPPQNTDIEEAVLGAILLEREKMDDVTMIIDDPDVFYTNSNRQIYSAILSLRHSGQTVDMLTVTEELRRMGKLEAIGGPFLIANLVNSVVSSANVISHARILVEKWVLRETIKLCSSIMANSYNPDADPFAIVEEMNRGVEALSFKNISKEMVSLQNEMLPTLQKIEEQRKIENSVLGITSGLDKVDEIIHGWKSPDLIILAARPSVGKTALALNFAYHGSTEKPVAIFSYEMDNEQLVRRLLSIDTQVDYGEIQIPNRMGESNWKKLQLAPGLGGRKIYMNDDRNIDTIQMMAICRRMQKSVGLGMIIVDYLQLMPEDRRNGNREQQISHISRSLKGIAKDLKVPVIALSQMSRSIEQSAKREPLLSDLRESGAIEQDADIVMFLYGASEDEIKNDVEKEREAYLKIAKHRGGKLKKLLLYKDLGIQTFMDQDYSLPFTNFQYTKPENPRAGIPMDYNLEPEKIANNEEDLPF